MASTFVSIHMVIVCNIPKPRFIFNIDNKFCINKFVVSLPSRKHLVSGGSTLLSFDLVFTDDAQCTETNKKSIFRFLFFELWSFF